MGRAGGTAARRGCSSRRVIYGKHGESLCGLEFEWYGDAQAVCVIATSGFSQLAQIAVV